MHRQVGINFSPTSFLSDDIYFRNQRNPRMRLVETLPIFFPVLRLNSQLDKKKSLKQLLLYLSVSISNIFLFLEGIPIKQ